MKITTIGKIIVTSIALVGFLPAAQADHDGCHDDCPRPRIPPRLPPPVVTPRPVRVQPRPVLQLPAMQSSRVPVPTDTLSTEGLVLPYLSGIEVPEVIMRPGLDGYVHACGTCQGTMVSDGNVVLIPAKGSLYQLTKDGTVKLARGRILAIGQKTPTTFTSAAGRVEVGSGASAVVEVLADNTMRTFVLTKSTGSQAAAIVRPASASDSLIELVPGQLAIVATHDLSNEEFISADGVDTGAIEGAIVGQTPSNVRLLSFSRQQVLEKNLLVGCTSTTSRPSTKAGQALKTVRDKLQSEVLADKGPSSSTVANARTSSDTVEGQSINVASVSKGHTVVTAEGNRTVIVAGDAKTEWQGADQLAISSGSALVRSKKALKVVARDSAVTVSRGATVLITANDGSLRVACLSEARSGSVNVSHSHGLLSLMSGQEVLLSNTAPALHEVYDIYAIGRRGIHSFDLAAKGWLTRSELSIVDALAHHPILKSVRASGDTQLKQRIVEPLVRTAAALDLVTGQKGAYSPGAPSEGAGAGDVVATR